MNVQRLSLHPDLTQLCAADHHNPHPQHQKYEEDLEKIYLFFFVQNKKAEKLHLLSYQDADVNT